MNCFGGKDRTMQSAVGDLLGCSARQFGTKRALITPDRVLTFAELDRLATRFAAALSTLGVQPGERITLWLENGWRWVVAYYGILRAGAVVNPGNSLLAAPEVSYMTKDCGAKALLAQKPKAADPAQRASLRFIDPTQTTTFDSHLFDDLLECGASALHRWRPPEIQKDHICSIFYTSGTTGYPRGAALRHESVILNTAMTSLMHGKHSDDTVVTALPCAHVYGNVVLNSAVACGMTLVLLPRLEELAVLDAVERYRATMIEGVPAMYLALLNIADIERFDLRSLRRCTVGGQGMSVSKMKEIENRLRCPFIELWGMTEIAGLGATHPYNGPHNLGSIGIALPFTQICIADPADSSRELPNGEVGELLVRGPHVMEGYFSRPEETAQAIDQRGWLHSGDLGRRDDHGYLYIVDRIKDVILSGGYTIYPAEIERTIAQLPGVAMALVSPMSDDLRGQIGKAYVVLLPGTAYAPEDIIKHCREHLAAYKVPRAVEFVSSLPTGSTGKLLRRAVH